MLYISNAFSANMLNLVRPWTVQFTPVSIEKARDMVLKAKREGSFTSAIGHQDLANIVSFMLGTEIPYARTAIYLTTADVLILAQYVGPRLPEGTTQLPSGAKIQFVLVRAF